VVALVRAPGEAAFLDQLAVAAADAKPAVGAGHLAQRPAVAAGQGIEIDRELDAGRPGIDDEYRAHYTGCSRAAAIRTAIAQEASRDCTPSAREVSTMGTRAPSTTPAEAASARYSSCLASML